MRLQQRQRFGQSPAAQATRPVPRRSRSAWTHLQQHGVRSAYIIYQNQYAKQLHIKLLGPLLSAASASLQNQQVEELVNEGAKAVIVNPETATSLGPAIAYAAAHHVKLIYFDTIVGVGKVYMVVRASNLLYGEDACAYISPR